MEFVLQPTGTGRMSRRSAAILIALVSLIPLVATAITAPAAGSFAYDIYNLVVVDILQGAIGFVAGLACVVFGATMLGKSWMFAIAWIIAGSVIINADGIVTSLGMLLA